MALQLDHTLRVSGIQAPEVEMVAETYSGAYTSKA